MRTFLLIGSAALILSGTSCNKSSSATCDPTPPAVVATDAEQAFLANYISTNGIAATRHSSGFYYEITNPGTGTAMPTICSSVKVTYIGSVIGGSGVPFDSNTTGTTFQLNGLITGWQLGIPLLKKGGSVKLYLPPSMGYGSSGSGSAIPPNSYLLFTVALLDFAN